MAIGKRRERAREIHRQAILESAKRLFAQHGFDATTMEEIATDAEFSKGGIYNYFPNKEEVFVALFEQESSRIANIMDEIFSGDQSAIEKTKETVRAHLSFFENNRDFFQIFQTERFRTWSDTTGRLRDTMVARWTDYVSKLSRVIEAGIRNKEFRKANPEAIATSLLGILNATVARWLMQKGGYSLSDQTEEIWQLFFHGIKR